MTSATTDQIGAYGGPAAAGRRRTLGSRAGTGLGVGMATLYLSLIVFIPLGAVVLRAGEGGLAGFWQAVTTPETAAALTLTVGASLIVVAVDVAMGTLIAWVLVRDRFPGQRVVDTLIDMPFALPTIVAGLVLLTLYGPASPVGIDLAYQQAGVVVALLFVTLPFVVRTVQPVLLELDREMEQAAASLGASPVTVFRRIVLPNLYPAITAGAALSFARAISEFGSTVLISGNLPFKTEVAAVHIFGQIQSDNIQGAAAESTVLLVVALLVLVGLDLVQRWAARRG
ncbi:MAG: sulfate ABC transporter permease subunit CysT [Chloroflexi bacterium]|nr:MAG: sulfate ABC transporter permease subunit CysT [Chloroflexota bacterium]